MATPAPVTLAGLTALLLMLIDTSTALRPLVGDTALGRALKAPISSGEEINPKIVGGKVAAEDRYPYASVLFNKHGQPFCSGSLIHPQVVITAAHCVQDAVLGVKVGALDWVVDDIMGRAYQARRVKKAIAHPDFSKYLAKRPQYMDMIADMGLLILQQPVPSGWPTLMLAPKGTKVSGNLTTLGYGLTQENAEDMSQKLREVQVDFIERSKCNSLLNRKYKGYNLTDANICAGVLAGGRDACNGDSGGPLIIRGRNAATDELVGLTSFGEGCAQKNVPGGYTNVLKYISWIKDTIAANKLDPL